MTSLRCRIGSPPTSSRQSFHALNRQNLIGRSANQLKALTPYLYYRALHSYRGVISREENEKALRFARQSISLDGNFSAAYGVALACYSELWDQQWMDD